SASSRKRRARSGSLSTILTGIALGPALADGCVRPAAGHRTGRAVMPWFAPLLNLDRSAHPSPGRGLRGHDRLGARFIPVITTSCAANAIVIGGRARLSGGGNNGRRHPINCHVATPKAAFWRAAIGKEVSHVEHVAS